MSKTAVLRVAVAYSFRRIILRELASHRPGVTWHPLQMKHCGNSAPWAKVSGRRASVSARGCFRIPAGHVIVPARQLLCLPDRVFEYSLAKPKASELSRLAFTAAMRCCHVTDCRPKPQTDLMCSENFAASQPRLQGKCPTRRRQVLARHVGTGRDVRDDPDLPDVERHYMRSSLDLASLPAKRWWHAIPCRLLLDTTWARE